MLQVLVSRDLSSTENAPLLDHRETFTERVEYKTLTRSNGNCVACICASTVLMLIWLSWFGIFESYELAKDYLNITSPDDNLVLQ